MPDEENAPPPSQDPPPTDDGLPPILDIDTNTETRGEPTEIRIVDPPLPDIETKG